LSHGGKIQLLLQGTGHVVTEREAKGGRTRRSDLESQIYLLLREKVFSENILKARK